MKTNIKLQVTPEQSKAVQLICFANNISWSGLLELNFLNSPYLFIDNRYLSYAHDPDFYNKQEEEEVNPELFIRTNGTCVESTETLTEECQFTKYGFEKPAFECEILKEYNDHLVGAVYQNEAYFGTSWNKQGTCLQTKGFGYTNMNLTPIKKPWYETCKFPCLIKYKSTYHVIDGTEGFSTSYLDLFIPLTNDEIEGLKQ